MDNYNFILEDDKDLDMGAVHESVKAEIAKRADLVSPNSLTYTITRTTTVITETQTKRRYYVTVVHK